MSKTQGAVRYYRGQKQMNGGRIYIIRYWDDKGTDKEIRIKEKHDTDAIFHSEDEIEIQTDDNGQITITNLTLGTSIKGKPVTY